MAGSKQLNWVSDIEPALDVEEEVVHRCHVAGYVLVIAESPEGPGAPPRFAHFVPEAFYAPPFPDDGRVEVDAVSVSDAKARLEAALIFGA